MPNTVLGKVSVTPKGAWSSSSSYEKLDIVSNGGNSYIALQNVPAGTALSNSSFWLMIAEKGDKGDKGDKGNKGDTGATGNGISSVEVEETSVVGSVHTYTLTISMTDGTSEVFEYEVTDGAVTSVNGRTGAVTGLAEEEGLIKAFPNDTASGDIASFPDGAEMPVKSMKVNVEPYQNLNGYEYPWVGGAGKNILPYMGDASSKNALTFTVADNGKITVNGTASSTNKKKIADVSLKANTTYFLSGCPSGGGSGKFALALCDSGDTALVNDYGSGVSYTPSTDGTFNVAIVYWYNYQLSSVVFSPQLEVGSSATSYAPYSNICPIYPANGVNQWDEEWELGTYNITTGEKQDSSTNIRAKNYIPCLPNTSYYLVTPYPSTGNVYFYGSDYAFISYVSNKRGLIDTPSNAYYMTFALGSAYGTTYNGDVGINFPSTYIQYVPYRTIVDTRIGKNFLDTQGRRVANGGNITSIEIIRGEACTITKTGDTLSCASLYAWAKARYGVLGQLEVGRTYTLSAHFDNPNGRYICIGVHRTTGWTLSAVTTATSADIQLTFVCDGTETDVMFNVNNSDSSQTGTVTISNIQLEFGSTATSYEPYTGERYYSRDYNMWDEETEAGYYDIADGAKKSGSSWMRSKNYVPCVPDTTYCYTQNSGGSGALGYMLFYDADKNYLGLNTQLVLATALNGQSFTTPQNAYYMAFYLNNGQNTGASINYSNSSQVGYGGVLDVDTGLLTVTYGVANLNGQGTYETFVATAGYVNRFFSGTFFANTHLPMPSANYNKFFTNYLATSMWGTDNYTFGLRDNGGLYITLDNTATQISVDDFKAFLTANPLTIVYELATSVQYQLTPTQVRTLLGYNNIWTDSGTVEVNYLADTSLYIQKLTGSTEEDMIANANIENGKYFMVGNELFLSTSAIAQGASIVVGTNCIKTNLADALNALNS